jgi:uncharacterized small protein (TIGR04563 family)
MLAETQKEAIRQDRSVSWIIQAAWRIARDEVRRMPAAGLRVTSEPELSSETSLPVVSSQDTRSQVS